MRQPYRERTAVVLKCVEIPGDANEWLACKKQGEFFIEKKCSSVILLIFREESESERDCFLGWDAYG